MVEATEGRGFKGGGRLNGALRKSLLPDSPLTSTRWYVDEWPSDETTWPCEVTRYDWSADGGIDAEAADAFGSGHTPTTRPPLSTRSR